MEIETLFEQRKKTTVTRLKDIKDFSLFDFNYIPDEPIIRQETDSNFGFNLPWWDRLFGTYRNQPAMGHESMTIGLEVFRDPKMLTLPWLLAIPFLGTSAPDSASLE